MVIHGRLVLLLIEQLRQRGLLVRAALEQKKHARRGRGIRHGALIKFRARERVHVSFERDELGVVDFLRNSRRNIGRLRKERARACLRGLRRSRSGDKKQNRRKKHNGIANELRVGFHDPSTQQIWCVQRRPAIGPEGGNSSGKGFASFTMVCPGRGSARKRTLPNCWQRG